MGLDNKVQTGEVGGTPASGTFAEAFTDFLSQILLGQPLNKKGEVSRQQLPSGKTMVTEGEYTDPIDRTQGIGNVIQDLISGPDISGMEDSLSKLIQTQKGRDVAELRERYTAAPGGTSKGTPAAVSESIYRADVAPKEAMAIGDLRMQAMQQQLAALMPLLQLAGGFTGLGTPQASTYAFQQPSSLQQWADLFSGASEVGGSIADIKKAGG